MTCHAHGALCRGLEKSLSKRYGRDMARARHGMCESNTPALCKSNGKDTIQTLGGTAWQGNGVGYELAFIVTKDFRRFPQQIQENTSIWSQLIPSEF
jgi:hypothetical protein